jgi:predicted CXXCH cytochrome family protein
MPRRILAGGRRRRWLPAASAALLAAAGAALADAGTYAPDAGVTGSPHDLSLASHGMDYGALPADARQRVCIYCHAPHDTLKPSPAAGGPAPGTGGGPQAGDAFSYLPLWNHQVTDLEAAYTMYQNGPGAPRLGPRASQAIAAAWTAPGSESLLCLSCHDGSVAVNRYGNADQRAASRSGGGPTIDADYAVGLGGYLGNHHPVGFDYDAAQAADPELRPADAAHLGEAGPVRRHLYGPASTRMECGTCHAVHNRGNTGPHLLWRSDTRSRLCLTCHAKGTDPGTAP